VPGRAPDISSEHISKRQIFSKGQIFRELLTSEKPLVLLGAYDALGARLIEQAGGKSLFIGGFSIVGARYGVPDVGLRAYADIAAAVRDIVNACDLPAFVDIDDGYGDVKNVIQTVQGYERMGVAAMMLEDQTWPKRCGHLAGKSVVPVEVMEAKVRAAIGERIDPTTFIFARTDARAVHGLDDAMRRAERYLRAGAEGLFVEAPESVEEVRRIGAAFKGVPLVANPLEGGKTPLLSPAEFAELGFTVIPYGITLILQAAAAMQAAIEDVMSGKFARRDAAMSFRDYLDVVGEPGWAEQQDKYGGA
jgi:2-methylisocitrate lyase-like PEP mutase family enzyme